MKSKRLSLWMVAGWLIATMLDTYFPHAPMVRADPISGSILISLAITAAVSAAQAGLGYLAAKKQKVANIDRGKQDDIRASVPGYGEFIPRGWGTFRVAPIWIWESPAVDHPVTTPGHSGGKGAPKPPTATTVDHVYLKSVAGVFHDGLIQKVLRIWFDNDLVANFVTSNAVSSGIAELNTVASSKYEAEYGTLAGGATVATQAECAGGKKVTDIDSGGGTCEVAITVAASTDYELAVHYTSTTDLSYFISVDGGADVELECQSSGGATIVAIETIDLGALTAGAHTLTFSNSSGSAPDLDCIDIAPARDTAAIDTRSFVSTIDVNKVPPTNLDHGWAYANFDPDPGDGRGAGGAAGTPSQSFALSKYGQPSIRIYPGSTTQLADSAIVAQEGADFASAYRGWAIIVIENIQLQNGRMPNVTLEVEQGTHSLPAIVSDIYAAGGLTAAQVNVTALAGLSLGDADIDAGTFAAPTYQNVTNATATGGGAITKTSGTNHAWNAHATANNSVASGDAALRFTAAAASVLIGYSTTATPTVTTDVLFGVILNQASYPSNETKNAVQAFNGAQTPDIGAWAVGDQFQVELRNGRFRVYQNGLEIQSFTPSVPSFPLWPCVFIYDTGAGVSALTIAEGADIGEAPNASAGGLLLSSRRGAGDLLNDLQTRFQFDMPEVDSAVKAILRNSSTADATIPYTDCRAVVTESGSLPELPPYDCLITDIDPMLLPDRVDVNYLDPGLDYHNNVQSEMALVPYRYDQQSVSLAIIDNADNMKALAITLLHKAEMEGRAFSFTTSWKWMHVHPGSIVALTLPNATHTLRITQAKYQLPVGVIEFEGVRQAPSLYSPTATGSGSAGFEPPIAPVPANTKGVIIDGPLLRAEDAGDGNDPVVYVAMCGRGAGAWSGAQLYEEYPIGSSNYEFLTTASQASQIGVSEGTLATVSDPSIWDRVNSLIINFYTPTTLSSATEADLLANPELNLLAVVNPSTNDCEYVQFKTAVAGSPSSPYLSRYTVSVFLRGRVGTNGNVASHTSADDVVVIDSTVKPRRMSLADIGR